MKKIFLTSLITLFTTTIFSQTKKAGIAFLYEHAPEITFYGMLPPRPIDAPRVFYKHGRSLTDSMLFQSIKDKIASILPQLGFRYVSEDSIINTPNYQALIKKNKDQNTPHEIMAKGYAYPGNFALLFSNPTDPDVMIEAYGEFEINNKTTSGSSFSTKMTYRMTIVGYNSKKKKVFLFKIAYENPSGILCWPTKKSSWGFEFDTDVSKLEKESLQEALKLVDAQLPEQIEKVKKFYSEH